MAKRHDETAVAWLADRATQGQMVRQIIFSLANSRLPQAREALTAVIWRSDTSRNDLTYTFNYLPYLRQPEAMVMQRELALGIPSGRPEQVNGSETRQVTVPSRIRIAALNNFNHRNAEDRTAIKRLIDDTDKEVRQAAREQLNHKFFYNHFEMRQLARVRAEEGDIDFINHLPRIITYTKDGEESATKALLADLINHPDRNARWTANAILNSKHHRDLRAQPEPAAGPRPVEF